MPTTNKPIRHRDKWRIRWTDAAGARRSEVHAKYKDAQLALNRQLAAAEEIRRGMRKMAVRNKRFDELCDNWLETRAAVKRSKATDESFIRVHLRPAFGGRLLQTIGSADAEKYKLSKPHLTKSTVNHHLTLLISMMRHAVEIGWLDSAPTIRKHRTQTPELRYLRTVDEVRQFLSASADEGPMIEALYATAVQSGLREGELAGLRWDDVDLKRRLITVQRSYDGPTKSARVRYVPIGDGLLPVLRAHRLRRAGRLVFSNEAQTMLRRDSRAFRQVLHRVLERSGLGRRYICFHGLRHTFATHWMMNGGDVFKLQKILGHQSIETTMRYAHLAPEAFATDHGRLWNLVAVPAGNVIPLRSAGTGD